MCIDHHLQSQLGCCVDISTTGVVSKLPSNLSCLRHSQVSSLFINKGQVGGVSDTFATCSDLVHDDTDTDWWAHSGSFHGCVCVTFKYVF